MYDPDNEFDEEYFEFGLFMSRREYKTINRRLQRGRELSVSEGKFVGNIAPFGYDRVKLKDAKGYTLSINQNEAPIVKEIFRLYAFENKGQYICFPSKYYKYKFLTVAIKQKRCTILLWSFLEI